MNMKKTETAGRKRKKPEFETPDPKVLRHSIGNLSTRESKEALILAAEAVKPENSSAFVMADYPLFGGAGVTELVDSIQAATAKIKAGDMSDAEAMLFSQAKALETIFTRPGEASGNQDYYVTLSNLSYPGIEGAKSKPVNLAGIDGIEISPAGNHEADQCCQRRAADQQQRRYSGTSSARTPENENLKNKLSPQIEDTRHERETLDFGTAAKTGRNNPEMVPVGKINRTKDRRR